MTTLTTLTTLTAEGSMASAEPSDDVERCIALAEWLVDNELALVSGHGQGTVDTAPRPHRRHSSGQADDHRLVGQILLDGARRSKAVRGASAATVRAPDLAPPPRSSRASVPGLGALADKPPSKLPPAAAVRPDAADRSPTRSSIVMATTGEWARNVGAVMILFVLYQFFGTGVSEAHAQQHLRQELALGAPTPAFLGSALPSGAVPHDAAPAIGRPRRPVPGHAVMLIRIPRLGLDAAVIEGTGLDQLAEGPGHYPGSALPGERGNTAIAGHRTTYGHPFNRLDELRVGDHVVLTTATADFDYTVAEAPRVVSPGDVGVINDLGDSRLTLTTCNPKYSASQRLVVVAHLTQSSTALDAPAVALSAAPPAPVRLAPSNLGPVRLADETGWRGNLVDRLATCLCAGLLVGAWQAGSWMSHRSGRVLGSLLAAPTVMALLLAMFERLNHILPANW